MMKGGSVPCRADVSPSGGGSVRHRPEEPPFRRDDNKFRIWIQERCRMDLHPDTLTWFSENIAKVRADLQSIEGEREMLLELLHSLETGADLANRQLAASGEARGKGHDGQSFEITLSKVHLDYGLLTIPKDNDHLIAREGTIAVKLPDSTFMTKVIRPQNGKGNARIRAKALREWFGLFKKGHAIRVDIVSENHLRLEARRQGLAGSPR